VCSCGQQIEYADKDKEEWYRNTRHEFVDKNNLIAKIPSNQDPYNIGVPVSAYGSTGDNEELIPFYYPSSHNKYFATNEECIKCGKKAVVQVHYNNRLVWVSPHTDHEPSKGPYNVEVTY
jgi:hypothetical protein